MKLSIIIPYYNTFTLTQKLLIELKKQKDDRQDIEIILINDGSNGTLLMPYADVFINKKNNAGVTCARNDGISVARGEYTVFIDSDDMIYEDYLKVILNKIDTSNFDLCWISWNSLFGPAIVKNNQQPNIAMWGCIYKTKILKNNKLNENYNLNEEPDFWTRVFKNRNLSIDYDSTIIYNYTIQDNSLTRRYDRGEIKVLKER